MVRRGTTLVGTRRLPAHRNGPGPQAQEWHGRIARANGCDGCSAEFGFQPNRGQGDARRSCDVRRGPVNTAFGRAGLGSTKVARAPMYVGVPRGAFVVCATTARNALSPNASGLARWIFTLLCSCPVTIVCSEQARGHRDALGRVRMSCMRGDVRRLKHRGAGDRICTAKGRATGGICHARAEGRESGAKMTGTEDGC